MALYFRFELFDFTLFCEDDKFLENEFSKDLLQTYRFNAFEWYLNSKKITAKCQRSSVFKVLFVFLRNEQREYSWKVSITNKLTSISGE